MFSGTGQEHGTALIDKAMIKIVKRTPVVETVGIALKEKECGMWIFLKNGQSNCDGFCKQKTPSM